MAGEGMADQESAMHLLRAGGRVGAPTGGLSSLLASQTRTTATIDLREPPGDAGGAASATAAAEPAVVAPPDEPDDPSRPLKGRLAVVTGGGGPLGRLVSLALLDAGARVGVIDADGDALAATRSAAAPEAAMISLECDLGSLADVEGTADFIERLDRPVDVLVHAATCHVPHGVAGDVTDLDEQYLVNLRGPYALTQRLLPQLRAAPGHVVFLTVGADPRPGDLQHAMTRAGVAVLADGLRAELAGAGVRVSVIRDGAAEGSVDPLDLADCVLGALEMPRRVEVSDLRVRVAAPATGR